MRFLVTGSRGWRHSDAIYAALQDYPNRGDTLVVGDATGVDHLAALFWRHYSGLDHVEIHRADWAMYGRQAGPVRNKAMVESGVELCLAFLMVCTDPRCRKVRPHGTHGTTNCIRQAQASGVRTLIWGNDGWDPEEREIGDEAA